MGVSTRSRTKQIDHDRQTDECSLVKSAYAKCVPESTTVPFKFETDSPVYNRFMNRILKQCIPYSGKRVFIVTSNTKKVMFVCPDYKIRIGKHWFSLSVTPNGYMYMHFLKNFVENTEDCLYIGDHVTFAPTSTDKLHYHVTRVQAVVYKNTVVYGDSGSSSYCTLPIEDIRKTLSNKKLSAAKKKEWFDSQICSNEYARSYNKTTMEMLFNDSDLSDIIFAFLIKGFS